MFVKYFILASLAAVALASGNNTCKTPDISYQMTCLKLLEESVLRKTEECQSKRPAVDVSDINDKLDNLKTSVDAIPVDKGFGSAYGSWELVFRVYKGVGGNVYKGYIDGTGTEDTFECLMLKSKKCVYRSVVIPKWSSLKISKVKYAIYKDGKQAAYVVFDGRGSDYVNWFDHNRIIETSWKDLKGNRFNFFSIQGDPDRQFYMSRNHGGCDKDFGWTSIHTGVGKKHNCKWDNRSYYPTILYSEDSIGKRPNVDGHAEADEMAILIQRG